MAFFLLAIASNELFAQTYIGANLGLWSNNSNWSTGSSPASGDPNMTITYAGTSFVTTTNDIAGPFELQSLVLASGAGNFTIDASSSPLIFNDLGAAPTIENQTTFRDLNIFSAVELADTLTINSAGGRQYFHDEVSGSGGLTLNGGTTYLQGTTDNTYSGTSTVNEGARLFLNKTNATAVAGDLNLVGGTATISGSGGDQINDSSSITLEATSTSTASLTVTENETVGNLVMQAQGVRSAQVSVNGGKTLTLSNDVTVQANTTGTGSAFISNGTVDLGGAARTLDVSDGTATTDLRVSSAITNGSLIKTGDGTMELTGANTYSGGTTVNGGVLRVATNGIQGNVINNAQVELTGSGTFSGDMSGIGSLAHGSGALTLSGSNTFTGGIQLNSSGSIVGDTNSIATDIVSASSSNLVRFDQASNGTYGGVYSGNGRLVKDLAGTLTLGAMNTYAGDTSIDGGTLRMGVNNAISASSDVEIATGANLDLNNFDLSVGELTGDGDVQLGSGNLQVSPGFSTYNGSISGTGGVTFENASQLTLTNQQTYTGGTNIDGGRLLLQSNERLADAGALTFLNNGRLDLNGNTETVGEVNLVSGRIEGGIGSTLNGTAYSFESGSVEVSLGGTAGLTKTGAGLVSLSGVNTYTGDTLVSEGTLSLSSSAIADTGKVIVDGGAINFSTETISELELISGQVGSGSLTASVFDVRDGSVGASLGGTGSLTKTTSGTVDLTRGNGYSGGTNVSDGTLIGSSFNSLQGDITNNGTLRFADRHNYAGSISGSGSVEITGSNVRFSGTNSYTGSTTIQGFGELIAPASSLAGDVSLAGANTTLEFSQSSDETYSNVVSGSGRVIKSGLGELTLTNANTFTGAMTVERGGLAVGNDAAIGTGDLVLGGNTTIRASGASRVINNTTTINRDVTFAGTEDLTFSNVLPMTLGNGESFTSSNTGTTTLIGEFNGESGSVLSATAGNFVVGDSSSFTGFRTSGDLQVSAGATLTLQSAGFIDMSASTILNGGTLAASNGVAFASSENLTGSGSINAKIAAQHGSIISATTGNMTIGRATSVGGFFSDGELYTNQYNVTINDANDAVLGSITRLGNGTTGGSLTAGTASIGDSHMHFLLEEGKNLLGRGTVDGNFKNQGHVIGDGTAMDERIVFGADWTVKGKGDFTNTLVLGTFAPGESPGITTGTNQGFGGKLEFELGGLNPGFGEDNHDQIIDEGMISLFDDPIISVLGYNGFLPELGDEFVVMTWEDGLIGSFGSLEIDSFFTSNGIGFEQIISGANGPGTLVLRATAAVPEPGTGLLLGLGIAALMGVRRRSTN